ncbi:MAG TPA: serine/threonine-protein kinase [Kofleriaceae bacterium]|nr:serine/threonine-protein kinase [Kofleriaceae bacterium]
MSGPRIEDLPTEKLGEGELPTAEGLRVGSVLADRYVIVRFVARGGMGEVYEVEDRDLGTRVALKTIRPAIASDPVVLARFHREIQVAREVTHPSVCRVFDLGKDAALSFLTMQLLSGETLAARLRRGALAGDEAQRILGDVIAGLSAAHGAGVIHRDLKPANIMVTRDGRAVITDFGLAITASRAAMGDAGAAAAGSSPPASRTGIAGTPEYMAPELLDGAPPSVATDVFALGKVMDELRVPRWTRAVRAATASAPSDRPSSAAAVLAMTRPDRRWLVALVGAILVAALAAAFVLRPRGSSAPPPGAIRAPSAVAADYAHAAAMLRDIHPTAARTTLRRVVAAAPELAPAHAQLAAAELGSGDPEAARAASARAVALIERAPRRWTQAEKLLVEARRAEVAGDWAAASAAWLALDGLDPTTTAHGVALAYTQMRAGQLDLAKQTIARLRQRVPDDPHVDLVEARVADRDGELDKEIALGKRVIAAAAVRGSKALAGQGHVAVGTGALYLGKAEEARAALDAAEVAYTAEQNPIGLSEVERMRSALAWVGGDLPGARTIALRALAIATNAHDLRGQANVHGTLAVLVSGLREFEAALDHVGKAKELYRQLGDEGQIAWAAQEMGSIENARGRLDEARKHWREGLEIAVRLGERMRAGDLAHNLGELALDEADLGAARIYFDQSLASYEAIRELRSSAQAELSLAWLLLWRGDTAAAMTRVQRSQELSKTLGEPHREVAAAALAAFVLLADGNVDDAALVVRAALARKAELPPETAYWLAVAELEVTLARRDLAGARRALAAARAASPDPAPAVSATLRAAELRIAFLAGERGVRDAARALRTGDVARLPLTARLELAIQLALLERGDGDRAATALLASLADEAASHGLALFARRARSP